MFKAQMNFVQHILDTFAYIRVMNYTKRGKYKLTNKKIAEMMGYNSAKSFDASSAKERILKGIDAIIEHIEDYNSLIDKRIQ